MQVLITHGNAARTRVWQFNRWQLLVAVLVLSLVLMLTSGALYHFVLVKAVQQGWPVVSPVVRLVVRDEFAQRDRFLRENLDAMAQKVGEMQAKLLRLEALAERVSGLAGVKPEDLKPLERATGGARGGPYVPLPLPLPLPTPSMPQLQTLVHGLAESTTRNTDLFTLAESRLLETRLQALMIPNSAPIAAQPGSGFGFRLDPITGHTALHTGLDFPAERGSPIQAAAAGLVVFSGEHPEYGKLLEIEHGNGLSTLYAHCSRLLVGAGTLVKRGQAVALVGNSGRSTGAHLHFEVLVDGVPQNPARFLSSGRTLAARTAPH